MEGLERRISEMESGLICELRQQRPISHVSELRLVWALHAALLLPARLRPSATSYISS